MPKGTKLHHHMMHQGVFNEDNLKQALVVVAAREAKARVGRVVDEEGVVELVEQQERVEQRKSQKYNLKKFNPSI